ncbi:MAG: hypothetical protein EOP86_08540 [Verrucomicrobiaceae bacterium]|nr:MAG: hypothetical protein EOP86_08540 [Verrucomicrobiaceae bacterium]
MTAEEAKMLLSVRRPGGADDHAPEMAEALAVAAGNPELAAWLAEEEAFDAAVTGRLREHEVPTELRARILAGMNASLPPASRKVTRRVFWWSAAAAAAAAAVGGLFQFLGKNQPQLAQFRTEMLDFFNHRFADQFDLVEPDPAVIRKWLQSRPDAIAFQAPGNLPEGKTLGCKIIPWRKTGVTLVCFMPPGSPRPIHIFAVRSAALAAPGPAVREFGSEAGWNTALWSGGDHTFMAISKLDAETVNRHLQA